MNKVQVEQAGDVRGTRFSFSYRGMDQKLIEMLRFDSNFETELIKIMQAINSKNNLNILVTKQDLRVEQVEGVSLVSYNRFSVDISYFEFAVKEIGTVYAQIDCGNNTGAAKELFTKMKSVGVKGGDIGCTAFADPSFIVKRSLAGVQRSYDMNKSTESVKARPIVCFNPGLIKKKTTRPALSGPSLKDAIQQISKILTLGKGSRLELLSGRASSKTINALVGALVQKGYYHLANTLTKSFL